VLIDTELSAMPVPDDFEAVICILRSDEGGRKTPARNGIRWDFNYAEEAPSENLYMIWPDFVDENGISLRKDMNLPLGVGLRARMTIVVDEMRHRVHRARIKVGTRFYCCEGPRRVAEGQVTKITGLFDDRAKPD
jgi:translation elongation factor EF-Tu-like GTPase